jgi:hypothetical protein
MPPLRCEARGNSVLGLRAASSVSCVSPSSARRSRAGASSQTAGFLRPARARRDLRRRGRRMRDCCAFSRVGDPCSRQPHAEQAQDQAVCRRERKRGSRWPCSSHLDPEYARQMDSRAQPSPGDPYSLRGSQARARAKQPLLLQYPGTLPTSGSVVSRLCDHHRLSPAGATEDTTDALALRAVLCLPKLLRSE